MTFDQETEAKYRVSLDKEFANHRSIFFDLKAEMSSVAGTFDRDMAERTAKAAHVKSLIWRVPNDTIFSVFYTIRYGTLSVLGDIGEATYQWSSAIDWAFLVNTNYDYFLSKCRGVDGHEKPSTWMPERIRRRVAEYYEDREYKLDQERGIWVNSEGETDDTFEDFENHLESREEWSAYLMDSSKDHSETEAWEWGEGVNYRSYAHWYGIKCAVRQLKESS
jgi:hypothetical protein